MASFHVMVIDVLSWLKLGYKRELRKKEKSYIKHKPLDINLKYTWCQTLKDVTENDLRFSSFFCISDKAFDFKETISEQQRVQAMKFVYENFTLNARS